MNNRANVRIYRLWSPVYDAVFGPLFRRARRRAFAVLDAQPGERLLIPGCGTGLDFPLIPAGVTVDGFDLSAEMLNKARAKTNGRAITLHEMDATQLAFPDAAFDAIAFMLVLSVIPDGAAAFREAWRTLKPGGRAVIFDKFLPDDGAITPGRRMVGAVIRALGTDPNRKLSTILDGVPDATITHNEASLLRGQYRIVRLEKR